MTVLPQGDSRPDALSPREIDHIAHLAHIGLLPDEIAELSLELAGVIEHVHRLREINTDGVEPTAHAGGIDTVLRDDIAINSWDPLAVLANAPRAEHGHFVVQAVLD